MGRFIKRWQTEKTETELPCDVLCTDPDHIGGSHFGDYNKSNSRYIDILSFRLRPSRPRGRAEVVFFVHFFRE